MTDRLFLLLERLQRTDALLDQLSRGRHAHPIELAGLKARKLWLKARLSKAHRRRLARHA